MALAASQAVQRIASAAMTQSRPQSLPDAPPRKLAGCTARPTGVPLGNALVGTASAHPTQSTEPAFSCYQYIKNYN